MVVCCLLMHCMNRIMSLANKYPCILLVSLYTCEIEYWEQAYICAFAEPIVPCTQCCTTCVIILRLPEITLCSWLGIKYQVLRLTYHYNDSYNTLQDEYAGIIHDAFFSLLKFFCLQMMMSMTGLWRLAGKAGTSMLATHTNLLPRPLATVEHLPVGNQTWYGGASSCAGVSWKKTDMLSSRTITARAHKKKTFKKM